MLTLNDSQTIATATSVATTGQTLVNQYFWDASVTITDTTPAAKTFARLSGNSFTITAHGYTTGLKVLNTTTVALPAGLTGAAEYVIVIDANTVQFATSQALALAGTAITVTDDGMGVQTTTPQALVGTLVVQKSNDVPVPSSHAQTWFTITTPTTAATQNVSAATLNYYDSAAGYPYLRFLMTITSGSASAVVRLNAKGF